MTTTNYQSEVLELLGLIATATPTALHPDAAAYRDRILSIPGGMISPNQLAALSTAANSIQTAGLRSKVISLYPLAGSNLASAAVKFYQDSHEDGDRLQLLNYSEADYVPATGLKGGWPRRVETGFNPGRSPMQDLAANGAYSSGLGFYCTEQAGVATGNAATTVDIYAATTPINTQRAVLINTTNFCSCELYRSTAGGFARSTAAASRTGFIYGTRINNDFRLYHDAAQIATATPVNDVDIRPLTGLRLQGQSATAFSNNRGRLYCLTLGMTDAEAIAFSTIMQTLGIALSTP
jgi:hypothetical protein